MKRTYLLNIRVEGEVFQRSSESFNDYHEAVRCGQDIGGKGNFYIEPTYAAIVPTREEQLLLPPASPRKRSYNGSSGSALSAKERALLRELNL